MSTSLEVIVFMCVCVYVCTFLCVYAFTCPCVDVVVSGRCVCVFVCYLYASPICMFVCACVCVCVCGCLFLSRQELEAIHTGRERGHRQRQDDRHKQNKKNIRLRGQTCVHDN